MSVRRSFEEHLGLLNQEILRMGVLVEEALRKAIDSLIGKDMELARRVVAEDAAINQKQQEIEDQCIMLIAREQPVATDLRRLITGLKIVTQLERIGDHALHVAKGALRLEGQTYMKKLVDIPRIAEIGIGMTRDSITAFLNQDAELAREVARRDQAVDDLHDQVIRELFTYMMEDTKYISQAITFMFISRFLERVADHVTNICEWVVYSATGEHVELNT